jgi:hypothetical protein
MGTTPGKTPGSSAAKAPPPTQAQADCEKHEERLIDEAVAESFPASDPPAIANPGGSLAVKNVADSGRDVPEAEPDPQKLNVKPVKRR